MATKVELVEMAMGAGLSEEAANAMTKAEIVTYLADASTAAGPEASDGENKPKKGKKARIVRSTSHNWWCPFCDNSNYYDLTVCAKCGAVKEDDQASLSA